MYIEPSYKSTNHTTSDDSLTVDVFEQFTNSNNIIIAFKL